MSDRQVVPLKRAKVEIGKLPYDCWCHVVVFFGDTKDFLSLVLTVKGLYVYIRKIYPSCTSNIRVRFSKISEVGNCSHFTSVAYRVKKNDMMLEYDTIGGFFTGIVEKFSNLKKMSLRLNKNTCKKLSNEFSIGKGVPSLSTLSLRISRMLDGENDSVIFTPSVPLLFLKELKIFSRRKRSRLKFKPSSKLKINHVENIRNVEYVLLEGWNLSSSFHDFQKLEDLRKMCLWNTLTEEKDFSVPLSTKMVILSGHSVSNFHNFSLPKGESIEIFRCLKWWKCQLEQLRVETYGDLPNLQLNYSFVNMVNLKRLRIEIDGPAEFSNDNGLLISETTFPRLECLTLRTNENNESLFKISIGPKLSQLTTFIVKNWNEINPLNEKCLGKLGYVRFAIRDLVKNHIFFKSLVGFEAYRNYLGKIFVSFSLSHNSIEFSDGVATDFSASFVGFKVLVNLQFTISLVDEISDCPKLQTATFFPSKIFKCSNNSSTPHIQSRVLAFFLPSVRSHEQSDLPDYLSKLRSWGEKLDLIGLHFCERPTLHLSGESYFNSDLSHVTALQIEFNRKTGYHKTLDIDLSDFYFVERLLIVNFGDPFPQYLTLKNFPKMKRLNIGSHCLNGKEISFSRVQLEDLPICEELVVGQGFASTHDVYIRNVNVKKIVVSLLSQFPYRKMYFRSKLEIRGIHFPLVERIDVIYSKRKEDKVTGDINLSIGVLENLTNLRTIVLTRKDHEKKPFVRSVRGIDLEKVTVECSFVEGFGVKGYWERGEKVMKLSLKQYIEKMNQISDEKIFVGQ